MVADATVVLGCGNFGGIGSAPAFFGQGETKEQAFALMDAAWELGLRLVRHRGRLRRRAQRAVDRRLAARDRQPAADHDEDVQRDGGRRRPRARARARAAPGGDEPRAARRRPDRPLPDARARPGHAGRGDATRRSRRSLERGAIGAWGVSATSARTTCASGSSSARRRSSRTRTRCSTAATRQSVIPLCARARDRVPGVQPARRRLADRASTAAARRTPEGSRMTMRPEPYRAPRERRDLRRARGVRAEGRASAASVPAGSRSPGRSAAPARSSSGPRRPEHLEPVREALALELSPAERDEVGSLFPC